MEHELDATMTRTGRVRRTQFQRTPRWQAVPPSKRGDTLFEAPDTSGTAGKEGT